MRPTSMGFYTSKATEYLEEGLRAKEKGDGPNARFHLLKAAEFLYKSAEGSDEPIRTGRVQVAERLVNMAESIVLARAPQPPEPQRTRSERAVAGDTVNASDPWMVVDRPDLKLADVAGLEHAKEQIRVRMVLPFSHPEMAKRFGVKSGGGILLYGPPGTGKTLLARAIAGEIDASLFVVRPSDVLSQWVGVAEQNVAKLFAAARAREKAIIFIDELEALVPRRTSNWSTVMQRVVPQILQEMEGFQSRREGNAVLFMGATNEPWALDEAVLRPGRLDEKIYVPLPERAARLQILRANLKDVPMANDASLDQIADATNGYSGADLRAVTERARHIPFLESVEAGVVRDVEMRDLLTAVQSVKPSVTQKNLERFERYAQEAGAH